LLLAASAIPPSAKPPHLPQLAGKMEKLAARVDAHQRSHDIVVVPHGESKWSRHAARLARRMGWGGRNAPLSLTGFDEVIKENDLKLE